jgi:DNA-binding transcriptional ArsR family regulator
MIYVSFFLHMNTQPVTNHENLSGDDLLRVLAALANPHRLQIVAALAQGRNYVSQLARELGISRPLLHMHLQRLEVAGLVTGLLELSEDGKAMKYFEVTPFALSLTPERIAEAARTLTDKEASDAGSIEAHNKEEKR